MKRRDFIKGAAGLFVPAAPALILPGRLRAQVGGLSFPGPGPRVTSGGGGFSVSSLTPQTSGGTNPPPSGTITIGATNLLVLGFVFGGSIDPDGITAVSAGGHALTQMTGCQADSTNFTQADFWYLASPPTSGVLSITMAAGLNNGMSVQPWAINTTTTTPTSGNASGANFGLSETIPITPPAGGAILGVGGIGGSTITLSPLTTDNTPTFLSQFGGSQFSVSGHSLTASGSTNVTVTDGVNNSGWVISLIAIAP